MSDLIRSIKTEFIKKHLKQNPNIVSSARATFSDFVNSQSRWSSCFVYNRKQYCFDEFISEEDFASTTGIKMIEGR